MRNVDPVPAQCGFRRPGCDFDRRSLLAMALISIAGVASAIPGAIAACARRSPLKGLHEDDIHRSTAPIFSSGAPLLHHPFCAIVQTVGGPIPRWAGYSPPKDPSYEIVILKTKGPVSDQARVDACCRFVLLDERIDDPLLPDWRFVIRAPAAALDIVAETLHHFLQGNRLIGVDFIDFYFVASGQDQVYPFRHPNVRQLNLEAAAAVVETDASNLFPKDAVLHAVLELTNKGFDGGLWIIALVSEEEFAAYTLQDFDTFITAFKLAEPKRHFGVTGADDATRSAVILFAFRAKRSDVDDAGGC